MLFPGKKINFEFPQFIRIFIPHLINSNKFDWLKSLHLTSSHSKWYKGERDSNFLFLHLKNLICMSALLFRIDHNTFHMQLIGSSVEATSPIIFIHSIEFTIHVFCLMRPTLNRYLCSVYYVKHTIIAINKQTYSVQKTEMCITSTASRAFVKWLLLF